MARYMTEEEINSGIESGNLEIINGVISGEIVAGTGETENAQHEEDQQDVNEQEETASNTEEVEEETVVDVDEREEALKQYEMELEAERKIRLEREAEARKLLEDLKAAENLKQERDRLAKELEEARARLSSQVKDEPSSEQSTEDEQFESDYSKATRRELEEIKKSLVNAPASGVQDIIKKLEALEGKLESVSKRDEAAEKERQAKQIQERLFSEIEEFQKRNEDFRTSKPVKDLHSEYNELCRRVSEFIGSKDQRDVNLAVYNILRGKTPRDKQMREKLEKVGVDIDNDLNKFLDICDMVDRKNGKRYDKYTGKLEDIVDSNGLPVRYRSLDEVYKLSDFKKAATVAAQKAVRDVADRLIKREESAVTLDNSETSDAKDVGVMSKEEIEAILDMSPSKILKNPALKEKLERAYKQLGIK